ncbi:MAG: SH3 domain-containing protein [Planctomycetes bacterium]|nr:SH3 domain-containing protein [Planctomycetota bacterium]
MQWWKKFPWQRLLALLVVLAVVLAVAMTQVRGDKMYVKVDSSSPDAVVQSSTDFFDSKPVGKLVSNQPVEMLDETDGEFVKIRATVDGKEVEGWVKKIILQKKPLENKPRVSESGAVENASFAAPGFNEELENGMRADSPEMATALKRIDDFEVKRGKLLGFDAKAEEPDMAPVLQRYRDFAAAGQLKD